MATWEDRHLPDNLSSILGHVRRPVEGGEKAPERKLHGRLIQDGERSYTAYSADELIEIDSLARHGRLGQPY